MIIVVATDEEYIMAKERFAKSKIIKTGVGGLNIIESLKDVDKNEEIFNFGHAGSNNLPIGTEVYIKDCRLYHPNVEYDESTYHLGGTIDCYTSNDFVLRTNITEPCVFDMELAYIMALGFKNVTSLKIVSDNLSLHEYNETISHI